MKPEPPHHPNAAIPDAIAEVAALWLARRDRGLSAAEQDAYLQWLHADPRHSKAVAQHAAALGRMMQLQEWQPGHDTEPNPHLFAPSRRPRLWLWSIGLAAAAAVTVGLFLRTPPPVSAPEAAPKNYLHVNERLALPDGSRVELKDGSRLVVQYSDAERRVRLMGGEAHFSVWKDAARPFVVEASGIEVRAVGTAFNVRLGDQAVEVLVTEGRVKVAQGSSDTVAPLLVSVRERAVVPLAVAEAPAVASVTNEEIVSELAWQAPRLQFHETPLAEAVAEFNRLNRHQIVIGDPELKDLRIGGTFRPDNVEAFVRLLGTTLGVRAEAVGSDRTELRQGR
ncbi:MAG: FecR domain-containing protein [Opitutaceae bacterium]|nr:FecR domain-containing protein [Opitutaceae bacterium]MBP7140943.1 FecR domain-containing protein [Opitutaceae bacterium]